MQVYFKDRFGITALPDLWIFFHWDVNSPEAHVSFDRFIESDFATLKKHEDGLSRDPYFEALVWLGLGASQKSFVQLNEEQKNSKQGRLIQLLIHLSNGQWQAAKDAFDDLVLLKESCFDSLFEELSKFIAFKLQIWTSLKPLSVEELSFPQNEFWRQFCGFLSDANLAEEKFRSHILKQGWVESLRDFDMLKARIFQDSFLLNRMINGTPFEEFQNRCAFDPTIPHSHYLLHIGPGMDKSFDLEDLLNNGRSVKTGDLPLRLLDVMTRDFYRPFSVYRLHEVLFAQKPYLAKQGSLKIHQLVFRLNRELRIRRCRLEVRFYEGAYHLYSKQGLTLLVPYREPLGLTKQQDKTSFQEKILNKLFGQRLFNSHEAALAFKTSERSTRRYLLQLKKEGRLEMIGKGPQVSYRLSNPLASQPQSL